MLSYNPVIFLQRKTMIIHDDGGGDRNHAMGSCIFVGFSIR